MKSSQLTAIGLILGAIVALFGALQPMLLAGGHQDLRLLIPAAVIAVVNYLEKEGGHWQTTVWYSVVAAVGAGATVFIHSPGLSLGMALLAAAIAIAGYFTADAKNKASVPQAPVTPAAPSNGPPLSSN